MRQYGRGGLVTTSWWDTAIDDIIPEQYLREYVLSTSDREVAVYLSNLTGHDVTPEAVRHKRRSMKIAKPNRGTSFPESHQPRLDTALVINTDDVLVIADLHADIHDNEWLAQVVNFAVGNNVKRCIIAGDLFDLTMLSTFTVPVTGQSSNNNSSTTTDMNTARAIVQQLDTLFDHIYMILGNHEERMSRKLGQLTTQFFHGILGSSEKLTVSEYHYCVVEDSSAQKWRITHPKNATSIPVNVARKIADKYRMNVVAAHGHDWGCTTSTSGYYAAASGMIADPQRVDYTQYVDGLYPIMQQGAWLLIDGQPVLLHPVWSKPY